MAESSDVFAGKLVSLHDDMLNGITSGAVGELGWEFDSPSGAEIAVDLPVANHAGLIFRSTGATSTTRTRLWLPKQQGYNIIPLFHSDEWFDVFFVVNFGNTTDIRYRVGWFQVADPGSTGDDPPNNGIYFEHLNTDTNWFAVCRATSTETRTNTNKALDTNYHKFRIRRVKAGSGINGIIRFTIDDDEANAIEIAANIPTAGGGVMIFACNTAAAAKTFIHDEFGLRIPQIARY